MTQHVRTRSVVARVALAYANTLWLGALTGIGHAVTLALAMAVAGATDHVRPGELWLVATVAAAIGATTALVAGAVVAWLIWERRLASAFWRLLVGAAVGSVLGIALMLLARPTVPGPTGDELLALLIFWGLPVLGFLGGAVWCRVRLPRFWRPWPGGCCQGCGYDRRGLGDSAPCPECGAPPGDSVNADAPGR